MSSIKLNGKDYEVQNIDINGYKFKFVDATHAFLQSGRTWYQTPASNKKIITCHHTASRYTGSADNQLKQLAQTHINNGWPGLAYEYVYLPSERTFFKLNNDSDVTWHDTINWDSIGFSIQFFAHAPYNDKLTKEQEKDVRAFLDWLCSKNPQIPADFDDVFGHRERSATACPGDLYFPLVSEYRTTKGNPAWGDYKTTDTGTSSDLDRKASRWVEIAGYFGIDVFGSPSLIKDKYESIKKSLEDAKNKLSNVGNLDFKGLDGVTRKVSFYATEYFNRDEQVKRLKEQITLLQKQIDTLSSDKDEVIKGLNSTITSLHTQINTLGKEKGDLNNSLSKLTQDLENCKNQQPQVPDATIIQKMIEYLNSLLKGSK